MSENTPDLNVLRSQLAYQNQYASCQGDVTGEFVGRYLESEAKLRITSESNKALAESIAAYQNRNEELKKEFEEIQAELKATNSNIKALENQNTDLLNEIAMLREKKKEITNQRQSYQEKAGKLSEEISQIKQLTEREKEGFTNGKRNKAQA